MSFRNRLSLFIVATLVVAQLVTAGVAFVVARDTLIDQGKQQLTETARVFVNQLDEIGRQVSGSVQVLALDYGLRKAVADNDRPTVTGALKNDGDRVGADRMFLVGLDGKITIDTGRDDATGKDFWFPNMLETAADEGSAASVVAIGSDVYWLVLVPVKSPEPIAVIGVGVSLNDRMVAKLQSLGSLPRTISIVIADGKGWKSVAGGQDGAQLASNLPQPGDTVSVAPILVQAGGHAEVMLAAPLSVPSGSPAVSAVLGYSVDEALARYRPLVLVVLLVLAGATAAALVGAMLIARGVARPVEQLAAATRRIEAGDYTPPPPLKQQDELGELSRALGTMAVAIGEREESVRRAAQESERAAMAEATTRVLARLGEAGQKLTARLDVEYVFTTLGQNVAELLDAPVLLVILQEGSGNLVLAYGVDGETRLPMVRASWQATDPTSAATLLVEAPAAFSTALAATGLSQRPYAITASLQAADRLLGMLWVQSDTPFGEQQQLILQTLAAYSAVALSNASAYRDLDSTLMQLRQTMEERERLQSLQEADLQFARELQIGTLPSSTSFDVGSRKVEIRAHMEALKEVGGDFYDFTMLDDHRLLFAIGDASGKGVPAAMFTSMARSALRAVGGQASGPAAMLAEVNGFLALNNPALMFVTLTAGVLDVRTGILTYSSAGHPYTIHVHPGDKGVELKDAQGMAVGIAEDLVYEEATYQIAPGDTLVLYSDGISELENTATVQYGEARIALMVETFAGSSLAELMTGMLADVDAYAGSYPRGDDLTLLSIRMTEAAIRMTEAT